MTLSILTYSIFTGMGYFAQSPWDLAGYRFLASLGMGGEWSLGVALVMESWPERWRPLMAGVIGAAANFGFLLVGAVGKIRVVTQDDWRWMWLVGIAPAGLVFLIRLFVPESEKWKTAKANSKGHSPIREVLSPPTLRWTLLAVCFSSIALIGTWGSGIMDTGLGRSIGRGNSTHRQGGGRHAECHGSDPRVCFWATDRGKIGPQTGLFRPLLCIACCLRCPFSHGAGLWNNLQMPRFFRRHDHGGILWLVSSLFT